MHDCEFCGKSTKMPFNCSHCNGIFCGKHRLPENHNCSIVGGNVGYSKGRGSTHVPVYTGYKDSAREKYETEENEELIEKIAKRNKEYIDKKAKYSNILIKTFIMATLVYIGLILMYPNYFTLSTEKTISPQITIEPTPIPTSAYPFTTTTAAPVTTSPPTTIPPTTTSAPTVTPPPTTSPAPTTTPPPTPPPPLEIIEHSFTSDPNGRGLLTGVAKNNAELTFTDVQIEGIFYDEKGTIVETRKSAPVGDLNPGETKNFNIRPEKLIQFTDHYEINILYSNEIPPPLKPTIPPTITPSPTTTAPTQTVTTSPSRPRTIFSPSGAPTYNVLELEKQIHDLINKERQKQGLSTLAWNDELNIIAYKYSQDMADRNYFSHDSPEGHDLSYRYEQEGFNCRVYTGEHYYYTGGENLFLGGLYSSITYRTFMGTTTKTYNWITQEEIAEDTVQGWMNSPGHRENILTPAWKTEGIGIAITDDYKVYATENFC